ncbi:MAG: hypothetical protein M3044_17015 [Thermoproteota archaeon]|nr:hypothetical protein [Thermoproteota archaeon]
MPKQFSSIAAVVVAFLAGILVLGAFTAASVNAQTNFPANALIDVTIQKTGTSGVDPLCATAPAHCGHQAVLVFPPRSDGKIWVGAITWTSSRPVELVVLHGYNQSVTPDAAHGSLLSAPFGKGALAITLLSPQPTPGGPIQASPIASGSMDFVGNPVAFFLLILVVG